MKIEVYITMQNFIILCLSIVVRGDDIRMSWARDLTNEINDNYKIWGFHGGDYEECRFLGYKNPVLTLQETHYVSVTEPSLLTLCKIWGFHAVTVKNAAI
jgi:hypothetical protein